MIFRLLLYKHRRHGEQQRTAPFGRKRARILRERGIQGQGRIREKTGTAPLFNPLIVTKDAESAVKLFEELGFEKRHTKEQISLSNATDIRMKDANGFHVDVTQGTGEWMMIRMNVDNLEEAVAFLEARGFHKARHAVAKDTIDTGTSKFNIMVSASGFILAVSQHTKDMD